MIIERIAQKSVNAALKRQAAVALLGARQVGKTTLAKEIGSEVNSHYVDFEDGIPVGPSSPKELLRFYQDRLLILDEVHLYPDVFNHLRSAIDEGRWIGNRTGRYLLLGSASIDIVNKSSQSLAGRIAFVEMGPLNVLEVMRISEPTQSTQTVKGVNEEVKPVTQEKRIRDLWFRGGLPDSFTAISDSDSIEFRDDFILTYLERDIPSFGIQIPSSTLKTLWKLLANSQGGLLNSAALATNMRVGAKSVSRYIDLLENLLIVRKLRPYQQNIKKRMIKSPKVYIRDSGLLHALLEVSEFDELLVNSMNGRSWEGFVIENLLSVAPRRTRSYFYRTAAGAEIDLVLKIPSNKEVWAIEIKHGDPTRLGRGFFNAIQDIKPDRAFVVYSGDLAFPVKKNVIAIGIKELSEMLHQLW